MGVKRASVCCSFTVITASFHAIDFLIASVIRPGNFACGYCGTTVKSKTMVPFTTDKDCRPWQNFCSPESLGCWFIWHSVNFRNNVSCRVAQWISPKMTGIARTASKSGSLTLQSMAIDVIVSGSLFRKSMRRENASIFPVFVVDRYRMIKSYPNDIVALR